MFANPPKAEGEGCSPTAFPGDTETRGWALPEGSWKQTGSGKFSLTEDKMEHA